METIAVKSIMVSFSENPDLVNVFVRVSHGSKVLHESELSTEDEVDNFLGNLPAMELSVIPKSNVITRSEWNEVHPDFRSVRQDGTPSMLRNEGGATVSVPVKITEDGAPVDGGDEWGEARKALRSVVKDAEFYLSQVMAGSISESEIEALSSETVGGISDAREALSSPYVSTKTLLTEKSDLADRLERMVNAYLDRKAIAFQSQNPAESANPVGKSLDRATGPVVASDVQASSTPAAQTQDPASKRSAAIAFIRSRLK